MSLYERFCLWVTIALVIVDTFAWAAQGHPFIAALWPAAGIATIKFNQWADSVPTLPQRHRRRAMSS